MTDAGIYFANTLLTSAIKQFEGQAYQTIETTESGFRTLTSIIQYNYTLFSTIELKQIYRFACETLSKNNSLGSILS